MRKLLIIIVAVAALYACSDHNFEIDGKITNAQTSMVYLQKLGVGKTELVDSSKIDKKGMFHFDGSVDNPTFFLLRLDNQQFVTLLADSADKISFSADYISFSVDYNVSGSDGSEKVKILNEHLYKTNKGIDSIRSLMSVSPKTAHFKKKEELWKSEIADLYIAQQDFTTDFINNNPFSMASILAVYQKFNDGEYVLQDIQTLKMIASALNSMYPESEHAQSLYREAEELVRNINRKKMKDFVQEYGVNSPELNLPDVNGKNVALSSLRGKYVLVHFWSAMDRGSRILNNVLSENYKSFNSKGFEIYQVSVDENREAWLRAIEIDKLNWINVGDMKGSVSAVTNYNVSSLPANYLLDPEGNIIARNLQGPKLHKTLNEILN